MQEERQMVSGLQNDYIAATKTLNATYKRLYAETRDGQTQDALAKSQKAWQTFRNANAIMRANYARISVPVRENAIASTIALYTTQTEMTKARIKELEEIRTQQNTTKKP